MDRSIRFNSIGGRRRAGSATRACGTPQLQSAQRAKPQDPQLLPAEIRNSKPRNARNGKIRNFNPRNAQNGKIRNSYPRKTATPNRATPKSARPATRTRGNPQLQSAQRPKRQDPRLGPAEWPSRSPPQPIPRNGRINSLYPLRQPPQIIVIPHRLVSPDHRVSPRLDDGIPIPPPVQQDRIPVQTPTKLANPGSGGNRYPL